MRPFILFALRITGLGMVVDVFSGNYTLSNPYFDFRPYKRESSKVRRSERSYLSAFLRRDARAFGLFVLQLPHKAEVRSCGVKGSDLQTCLTLVATKQLFP